MLFISCSESSEEKTLGQIETQETTSRYGKTLKPLPNISEVARKELVSWSVFEDYETNVNKLKNKTVAALLVTSKELERQTDSLLQTIPEVLDTRPIYARLLLSNTRTKLLLQQLRYDAIDSLGLETSLQEMNIATESFFIEINRTFKKNKIDEELKETEKKELEKQKRFLDSVYQSEIKDNG